MYPSLFDRTKAAMVDGVILMAALIITSDVLSSMENVPNYVKMVLMLFYFVLYEPLFLCINGGTIGHNFAGIKVKRYSNQEKNISFFAGIIRFFLKIGLGWISLITFFTSSNKRTLHDMASGSIMLYK